MKNLSFKLFLCLLFNQILFIAQCTQCEETELHRIAQMCKNEKDKDKIDNYFKRDNYHRDIFLETDSKGDTPFHTAIRYKNQLALKEFLNQEPCSNVLNLETGLTPFMTALKDENIEFAIILQKAAIQFEDKLQSNKECVASPDESIHVPEKFKNKRITAFSQEEMVELVNFFKNEQSIPHTTL